MSRPWLLAGTLALVLTAGTAAAQGKRSAPREPAIVVFVCQHGNVKSVIATQWFNRLAAERGLSMRAVSRGVEPETPVPAAVAEHLRRDGFDVQRFEPRTFTPADLEGASRVVMIGLEPPAWIRGKVPAETWEEIPSASERYEASRDAMCDRIVSLLKTRVAPRRDR